MYILHRLAALHGCLSPVLPRSHVSVQAACLYISSASHIQAIRHGS